MGSASGVRYSNVVGTRYGCRQLETKMNRDKTKTDGAELNEKKRIEANGDGSTRMETD